MTYLLAWIEAWLRALSEAVTSLSLTATSLLNARIGL